MRVHSFRNGGSRATSVEIAFDIPARSTVSLLLHDVCVGPSLKFEEHAQTQGPERCDVARTCLMKDVYAFGGNFYLHATGAPSARRLSEPLVVRQCCKKRFSCAPRPSCSSPRTRTAAWTPQIEGPVFLIRGCTRRPVHARPGGCRECWPRACSHALSP